MGDLGDDCRGDILTFDASYNLDSVVSSKWFRSWYVASIVLLVLPDDIDLDLVDDVMLRLRLSEDCVGLFLRDVNNLLADLVDFVCSRALLEVLGVLWNK